MKYFSNPVNTTYRGTLLGLEKCKISWFLADYHLLVKCWTKRMTHLIHQKDKLCCQLMWNCDPNVDMVGVQILGVWVLIFSIPIDWPEIKGIIFHFPSEKPMKMIGMVFKVSFRKCVIVFKACFQLLRFERGKAHLSVHFSSSLKKNLCRY